MEHVEYCACFFVVLDDYFTILISNTIREKTVCFTGYHTSKILKSIQNQDSIHLIEEELHKIIYELYSRGYDTFITSGNEGFELMAAEAVLLAKEK